MHPPENLAPGRPCPPRSAFLVLSSPPRAWSLVYPAQGRGGSSTHRRMSGSKHGFDSVATLIRSALRYEAAHASAAPPTAVLRGSWPPRRQGGAVGSRADHRRLDPDRGAR